MTGIVVSLQFHLVGKLIIDVNRQNLKKRKTVGRTLYALDTLGCWNSSELFHICCKTREGIFLGVLLIERI